MFIVTAEIPEKWLQMRCGSLAVNAPVKGYQECRFDVKEGEVFKVLNKICEKGRTF